MATTNSNASRPQRSAAAKRGQATRSGRPRGAATHAPSATTSTTAAAQSSAQRRRQARRGHAPPAGRPPSDHRSQRTVRAAASQRVRAETKQAESVLTQVTGVAESALLVPVGAALEVRDRVVGAIQPWTSRPSAEKELNRVRRDVRRFERRGTVARNRVAARAAQAPQPRHPRAAQAPQRRRPAFLRLQRNSTQRTIKTNGKHAQARTARFRTSWRRPSSRR